MPSTDKAKMFQASNGWLLRFLKRFNLVVRRISSSGRELPKNCCNIVYNYLKSVNQTIKNKRYTPDEVIYFDEISMCANMLQNHSYDISGKAKISVNDKVRLSCIVASTLNGKKLPIIILAPKEIQYYDFLQNREVILLCEPSGM
jgi:hypothetical protein